MSDDIKKLPGIKAREIGPTVTGKRLAQDGPVFYRVTIETCAIDACAVQRQVGLEMVIGNAAIAHAMGPDEDLAKIIDRKTVFVTVTEAMLPLLAMVEED
jgi:hypothetical protein